MNPSLVGNADARGRFAQIHRGPSLGAVPDVSLMYRDLGQLPMVTDAAGLQPVADDVRRLAIANPSLDSLAILDIFAVIGYGTPIYDLGEAFETSPIPPTIAERCGLPSSAFAKGRWSYQETWARPGTHVELAGCRMAGSEVVAACTAGPARGHLAAHGLHALVGRMADRILGMGVVVVVSTFFTAVGGIGALLALRRAAGGGAR
jgi:hypothetical protein